MFKGKNVLVAGGTGFVGINLIKRMLSLGAKVRAANHRKAPVIKDDRIDYVACDLISLEDCRKVVADMDYVFMCAANTSGAIGQRSANFTQQNADWLLIIGARLDLGQTAYSHANFACHARKIMVDIDPAEINKLQMAIDVPVNSDAGAFLREFDRHMSRIEKKDRSKWLKRCKEWQAKYPVVPPGYWKESGHVNDYVFSDVLSDELSGKDLLIPESSDACSERTMQARMARWYPCRWKTSGLHWIGENSR